VIPQAPMGGQSRYSRNRVSLLDTGHLAPGTAQLM